MFPCRNYPFVIAFFFHIAFQTYNALLLFISLILPTIILINVFFYIGCIYLSYLLVMT